jgi:hypothetical protein
VDINKPYTVYLNVHELDGEIVLSKKIETSIQPDPHYRVWGSHEPEVILGIAQEVRVDYEYAVVTYIYEVTIEVIHQLLESQDANHWTFLEGHH